MALIWGPKLYSVTDIIRFGRIVLACGANGEGRRKAVEEVGMMTERVRRGRRCGINKNKLCETVGQIKLKSKGKKGRSKQRKKEKLMKWTA